MSDDDKQKAAAEAAAKEKAAQEAAAKAASEQFPVLKQATELLQKLEEKEKSILEREQLLDKKLKQIDQAAAEAKLSGYGQMRHEETAEEKAEAAAMTLLKGTGFERYLPPKPKK